MAKLFRISISTPQKSVYEGDVSSLVAPGELGYLGILANHAPLITNLVRGKITFKESSDKQTIIYSKGKGFLEVLENNVTLLLDDIEPV
jgi:F-type H+-transporting ATPase subunit epsilon